MSRYLIVGLGNPGTKYEGTRHNIGFGLVERFARRHQISLTQTKFHGRYGTGSVGVHDLVLLEPQTFMNLSGQAVAPAAKFFDLDSQHIIVAHDELDLALATLRIKAGGGHGGHNGLRDIIARLGNPDFSRLRLGIGRPEHGNVTAHVLAGFRPDEQPGVDAMLETACDALETLLAEGMEAAQNRYN
ncbi:MAG: aminoacyl-tRNA hydrolase [Bradymonadaceae bacterium]|nr:aminoacyl-tRNA hydrolase [Lujinxingiaceae bacterium]